MLTDGIPERGPFTFPEPWNSRACRVTNADDGVVRPVGYTYWPQMNNSAGRDWAWIFLSLNDRYTLFRFDKASLNVERVKELPFDGWGEGSYFSFTEPDRLYVPRGSQLLAHDVETGITQVVFEAPGQIRQCHSSADGQVHSLTLDGLPAVHRRGEFQVFHPSDTYDECQIDKSGKWLLLKEGNYNRVYDLDTPDEETIIVTDPEGAVGHSDMGYGYMVGEEDQSNPGGVFRLWQFPHTDRGPVYTTGSWDRTTRYVSHCNATPGDPASQSAVFSSIQDDIVWAPLDGSMNRRRVAPSLCAPSDDYWQQPRATLDPTGAFAIWTANLGSDRLDAFVVQIGASHPFPQAGL